MQVCKSSFQRHRSKNHKSKTLLLGMLISMFSQGPGLSAEDYLKQGNDYYKKGNYKNAALLFEHCVRQSPKDLKARYHLANTYLKLNKLAQAKAQYDYCIKNSIDPTFLRNCVLAVQHIERLQNPTANPTPDSPAAAEAVKVTAKEQAAQSRDDDKMKRYREKVAELEARKEMILNEAKERGRIIVAEAQKRLEEAEANTNQRLRNIHTGERRLGLTDAQELEIIGPARAEAKKLMDDAELRVRGIQMPPEPILERK